MYSTENEQLNLLFNEKFFHRTPKGNKWLPWVIETRLYPGKYYRKKLKRRFKKTIITICYPKKNYHKTFTGEEWKAKKEASALRRKLKEPQYSKQTRLNLKLRKPWIDCVKGARARVKKLGLPFDLTNDWAKARYTGNCELTGLPFVFTGKLNSRSCTIDKQIPALGYIQSNCRFVVHCINCFKLDDTEEAMYDVAEALIKLKKVRDTG